MRIALLAHLRHPISPPFMGGMEAHSYHLATALVARGHDVTLFASGDSRAAGRLHPVVEHAYAARYAPDDPAHYRDLDIRFACTGTRLLRGDFDVVHNNTLHRYPPRLARQHRLACVTSLHVPPFEALQRAVLESAAPWSRFTVTSNRQRQSWWGRASPPEAAVVHNGIDPDLWPSGLGGNGRAVWAGRITPNKGAHLALEAARLAGMPLTIFGPIEDRAYFDIAVAPHLGGDFRYGGHLERAGLAAEFARADLLLFTPLWDEPFGLTAIEAMCCGLPVASTDMGAAREVIGRAGCFAAEPVAQDLAHAMTRALAIPRDLPRRRVMEHFTITRMVDAYEAEYLRAVAGLRGDAPEVSFPAFDLMTDNHAPPPGLDRR